MAKKPGDLRALKRRYGHRLQAMRYQAIERAGDNVSRRLRAERLSDYEIMKQQLARDVAKLKRKGYLPPTQTVRKPTLTAQLSKKLNDLYEVVTGRRRGVRVSKEVARKLKDQGYPVVGDRVLLGSRYTLRKGIVYEKMAKVGGGPGRRVSMIRLTGNVHLQAEALLASLKPEEYVGFELGSGYTQLFGRADLYTDGPTMGLLDYLAGGGSFDRHPGMKYLTVHYIQAHEAVDYYYAKERAHFLYLEGQRAKRRAASKRRRDLRRRNKG